MGDSAGGGLALGYAMKISREEVKQPTQIILFSPWLDVSMSNPDVAKYADRDPILHVNSLKIAGKQYAGELDTAHYWVSPIYGDFSRIGKVALFAGTHEVMVADARKLSRMLAEQHIGCNYYEYPGLFHDWVLAPWLKETQQAIQQVVDLVGSSMAKG